MEFFTHVIPLTLTAGLFENLKDITRLYGHTGENRLFVHKKRFKKLVPRPKFSYTAGPELASSPPRSAKNKMGSKPNRYIA